MKTSRLSPHPSAAAIAVFSRLSQVKGAMGARLADRDPIFVPGFSAERTGWQSAEVGVGDAQERLDPVVEVSANSGDRDGFHD